MWPKYFDILIIWMILHVDCFPTNNVVKSNSSNTNEDDSPEYGEYFQGDMILSHEQMEAAKIGDKNGMVDKKYKWPGGIVPFLLEESHFNPGQIEYINMATKKIENVSCVKFVPYNPSFSNDHIHYLHVQGDQPGCFSEIGYQRGTSQILNVQNTYKLDKGCFVLFSIVHEFFHSLGFHHMQSSSDRNEYIRVNRNNIIPGFQQNFMLYPESFITHYGVEYDYGSVMHYSNKAFSFDHKSLTIEPLRDLKGEVMGQRDHLSEKDILRLNRAYCEHTTTTTTKTMAKTTTATTTTTIGSFPGNEVTTGMAPNRNVNSFIHNFMNSIFCSGIYLLLFTIVHIIYKIN